MQSYGWVIILFLLFVAAAGGYAWFQYCAGYHAGKRAERERWKNHQQEFLDSLLAIENEGIHAREAIMQEMTRASSRIRRQRPRRSGFRAS